MLSLGMTYGSTRAQRIAKIRSKAPAKELSACGQVPRRLRGAFAKDTSLTELGGRSVTNESSSDRRGI